MTYYLLCISYLDYENDGRQKANLSDFLILVQNRHKADKTTHNINNASGPGTASECTQCSGGQRSFAKEMRVLKMSSTVAGHWKLTTTN